MNMFRRLYRSKTGNTFSTTTGDEDDDASFTRIRKPGKYCPVEINHDATAIQQLVSNRINDDDEMEEGIVNSVMDDDDVRLTQEQIPLGERPWRRSIVEWLYSNRLKPM